MPHSAYGASSATRPPSTFFPSDARVIPRGGVAASSSRAAGRTGVGATKFRRHAWNGPSSSACQSAVACAGTQRSAGTSYGARPRRESRGPNASRNRASDIIGPRDGAAATVQQSSARGTGAGRGTESYEGCLQVQAPAPRREVRLWPRSLGCAPPSASYRRCPNDGPRRCLVGLRARGVSSLFRSGLSQITLASP